MLVNVLAHELEKASVKLRLDPQTIFTAVANVHRRVRGAYAVVAMIAGYGVLAFRDPFGIRPAVIGYNETPAAPNTWWRPSRWRWTRSASACCATSARARRCSSTRTASSTASSAPHASLNPCIFEYVYLARPDSLIDGASVYESRLNMGEKLGAKIRRQYRHLQVDVVIPIPDSSRPSALQLAAGLGVPYREGFVKNRYIGRTFIMPGQAVRTRSVRQKLNPMAMEFSGKNVLLVDDSIVRGTTSREIVQMARESGARKVFFASAAPPVRFPNVYGIDMPTRRAHRRAPQRGRGDARDRRRRARLPGPRRAQGRGAPRQPALTSFETSCFDGHYITGDITRTTCARSRSARREARLGDDEAPQLDLNLAA